MLHNDPRKISGLSQKHAFSEGWHEIMALASVQPRFESKQKYVVKNQGDSSQAENHIIAPAST